MTSNKMKIGPELSIQNLSFYFENNDRITLDDVSFDLPPASRTLLIGANGAGKTTLLRILAGKRLAQRGIVQVQGLDPFRQSNQNVTYLGTEWSSNPVVRRDMPVSHLLASIGADSWPERRDKLVNMLDVDIGWRMHAISDGERRRVELLIRLVRPWNILLLDEVTVDLDVLVRAELLNFLKTETGIRGSSIVYATHIFDGLANWPTHLIHMSLGKVLEAGPVASFPRLRQPSVEVGNSSLLELCLDWLRQDRDFRGKRGEEKRTKWEDISDDIKFGDSKSFGEYFKMTRGNRIQN